MSKLLERVVHNNLMHHILDNGLLSDYQFSFRPLGSTHEAILSATREWYTHLEERDNIACIVL